MNWKGHLKWGFIIVSIITILDLVMMFLGVPNWDIFGIDLFSSSNFILYGFVIPSIIIAFIVGLYGSLFPDVDIGTSKAFAITYMILILLTFYYAYTDYLIGLCTSLVIMALILGLKHRGIMHRWYTGLILGIMFVILFENVMVGTYFVIGYWTHLVCDIRIGDD